eukprot:15440140-Alexandrium_andersonii.AAC.1
MGEEELRGATAGAQGRAGDPAEAGAVAVPVKAVPGKPRAEAPGAGASAALRPAPQEVPTKAVPPGCAGQTRPA